MARRFEPLLNKSSKRQKLELVVNSSHLFKSTIAEFWDSDDDDVVLLATQQAEENQRQPDSTRQTEHDFELRPLASSTQQPVHKDQLSTSLQCPKRTIHQRSNEYNTTNLPSNLGVQEIFGLNKSKVVLPEVKHVQSELENQSTNQWVNTRQKAQEQQLKFLIERVDVLKKENSKLQKDLIDHSNQTMIKEGEVSLLRNELRQARKSLQTSTMEKIKMIEAQNKEVLAKNTELALTNVDISRYKIRRTNNSWKKKQPTVFDADDCRNMLRMENLCITKFNGQFSGKVKHKFYDSKESRTQKKQRNFFELELEHLIFNYAQLQFQTSIDPVVRDCLILSVHRVFKEFLTYAQTLELPKHHLPYPYHHYDLEFDHNTSQRNSLIQSENLYKAERGILLRRYITTLALICERHCNLSQALLEQTDGNYSILQLLIEAITKLSYSSEVIEHFGVIEATGTFLQSLLSHINTSTISTLELHLDSLFNLLKQLVFTRPNIWAFQKLSSCMLLCANHEQFLARMCIDSNKNYFVSDRVRSLYRFGPESCLIQVYAGLLELCFCSEIPLRPTHFKLLLSICHNHVRFVYQCFTAMPKFIIKMHPFSSFADDENTEETILPNMFDTKSRTSLSVNNSTSNKSNPPNLITIPTREQGLQEGCCECYVKLCLSVVTLVFQMMYQWTLQDEKTHVSLVGEISQTAIHLLILIFREYYVSCIFRDSEETTKHNLSLLCGWWNEHTRILDFQDTHVHFLKQLQELQFMLKPMHQEAIHSNPDSDLADWKRFTNKDDVSFEKFDLLHSEFKLEIENFFNNLKTFD